MLSAATAQAAAFTRRAHLDSVDGDSAELVFQTDSSCAVTVRYGAGTELNQSVEAPAGKNHSVTLSGLTPGTGYSYQIEACGSPLGDVDAFQTATTAKTMRVHFAVNGDMGTGTSTQTAVANAMHRAKPEFWLSMGDNAYSSGTTEEYTNNFFRPMAELLEDVPTFPTLGNHEYVTSQATPYLDAFTLPTNNPLGTERYYSFEWGPVHVVSIDGECAVDYDTGGCDAAPQLAWLRADLAAAASRPWKIVLLHRPPWSSGEHGSNTKVRRTLTPIFEEFGVDVVLTGHDHDYERIKPMRGESVDEENGITYLVVGSGGATFRPFDGEQPAWSAYRNATDHGFLDVVIDGGTLTGRFVRHDDKVLDTFTLTKPVAMPEASTLTVVAEPASGTVPLRTSLNAQTNLENPQFSWTLPDGSARSGNPVNLELTESGSYTATVTATGGGESLTQSVTVAANQAGCEATNSCVAVDGGGSASLPPGPPESGCGSSAALVLPFGLLGLALRRRRSR